MRNQFVGYAGRVDPLVRLFTNARTTAIGCIEPNKVPNSSGYPQTRIHGRLVTASRYVYERKSGEVLARNQHMMHTCDNTMCINYDHLRRGTQKENMRDCVAKGRHASGGTLTPEQVRWAYTVELPAHRAAKRLRLNAATVYRIRNGISYTEETAPLRKAGVLPFRDKPRRKDNFRQRRVIGFLKRYPGSSIPDVMKRTGMSREAITSVVLALSKQKVLVGGPKELRGGRYQRPFFLARSDAA